jgi:cytochrome c2
MMSHAGRDPIFWATVAIAEQDFDGSGDLCIRCHSTGGWLAGRSTPTDGSGLAEGDSDGVECDYCHKVTNPDNSDPSLQGVMTPPFIANEPNAADPDGIEGYYGSGMSSMWGGSDKLGPYDDAEARHQFMQSKFHRDRDFCGTCHDVSNPAVGNLAHNHGAQLTADPVSANGQLGGPVDGKAAFNNPPYKYGIVERTFSEYKAGLISQTEVKEYPNLPADLQGGALQAIYEAATAAGGNGDYADGDTRYYSCQSCHMRPVTGAGCNKKGSPIRTDLPLHDMTGGNYWMPEAIEYLDSQGKLRLGGGMTSDQVTAMLDGALRAKEQLNLAASLTILGNPGSVKVVNHTGHKLISGYPEGRRMWLNIKWYDGSGALLDEQGEYGDIAVMLDGEPSTVRSLIDLDGADTKIYEAHMGMTQEWAIQLINLGYPASLPLSYDRSTGAVDCELGNLAQIDIQGNPLPPCDGNPDYHETFHFVLNNMVAKDNRIPPYRMSYDVAQVRNALPVPANQYGGAPGGDYDYFDEVPLSAPAGAQSAEVSLMYQPTSWEYIQFLYLANNGTDPAQGGNAFLGEEGVNMLDAWLSTGMAEPYVMASTTWGTPPGECDSTTPTMLNASPGDKQVSVNWQAIPGDPDVIGYKLYYDQSGKAQLVVDLPCPPDSQETCTSYTDTGLTNGQQYCYKVTSYSAACESGFSDILCAIPTQPGQEVLAGVVEPMQTGKWVTEGKGKNQTTTFMLTSDFTQGEGVVIQATVKDEGGAPVPGATATIVISGPESAELTTGPSDANGVVEATWNTQSPNKKGQGGTAIGGYTATTSGVTASGFVWDQVPTSATFTIGQ